MLLEFRLRNFRSFRDEQTFTLIAEDKEESHSISIPGSDEDSALRTVAVYGPNASGKTNLLLALRAMQQVVVNSATATQRGDQIEPVYPFRLNEESRNSPTMFDITFVVEKEGDKVEFQYGFEATRDRVIEEWLYSYPHNRPRKYFTREYKNDKGDYEFGFGDYFKGQKKQIAEATRPNALYLSTAAQLNNKSIAPVFDWFRNSIQYLAGRDVRSQLTERLCEDDSVRQVVVDLLKAADVGIRDLHVEEGSVDVSEVPSGLLDFLEESGQREKFEEDMSRIVHFQHSDDSTKEELLSLQEESRGTRQYFSLLGPVMNSLGGGQVLLIDELDSSLHPLMVEEVIRLFNDPETNPNGAQLIFNLHDTSPFDKDIINRDQIWITEKFPEGNSELIALLEYSPRENEAMEKKYREGKYGGIPIPRIVKKAKEIDHATSPSDA
jgi:AAA15 family ATPase/GTPase